MAEDPRDWEIETRAVRGGMARSEHGEISEALFLTQSFSYDTAQAADERFAGGPGFIYQRFGNPTTQMFEERLALMEGAELCRATASGMSAVHLSLCGLVRAGDHDEDARTRRHVQRRRGDGDRHLDHSAADARGAGA